MSIHPLRRYEELANVITHGIGAVASLVGAVLLIAWTAPAGDPWRLVSALVYGGTLVLLYGASTSYHAMTHPKVKNWLEILDHCAIFGLIAGTYTPFMLVTLRGGWGWSLFGVVWGISIVGITLKLFYTGRFRFLSTMLYIGLGWLVVVAVVPMVQALPLSTLLLLLFGGLAYTGGTVFYLNERLPFSHAIWHLFVLGGSICHFLAVFGQLTV
jgi:hemolysin III